MQSDVLDINSMLCRSDLDEDVKLWLISFG